ncbi:TVP38/TMEM64 family protein [Paenibacillus solani]|uniref:TVP38/TMEM64 family protein n=1 Tax=Paenibacillus solani TaxID=1705565 RepID=UPI003D2D4806
MKKWILPAFYASLMVIAFVHRYEIMDWLGGNPPFILMILLATLLALFPVAPYKVVIAILGYAYGTVWAAAISWFGTTIAAIILYVIVRTLYREAGRRLIDKYSVIRSFTGAVERRPFQAILLVRMLPIVPQMAVNIYAGVAAIPFWTYAIATGIGKIPAILLYAWLGSGFVDHPVMFTMIAAGLMLVTVIGVAIFRKNEGKQT